MISNVCEPTPTPPRFFCIESVWEKKIISLMRMWCKQARLWNEWHRENILTSTVIEACLPCVVGVHPTERLVWPHHSESSGWACAACSLDTTQSIYKGCTPRWENAVSRHRGRRWLRTRHRLGFEDAPWEQGTRPIRPPQKSYVLVKREFLHMALKSPSNKELQDLGMLQNSNRAQVSQEKRLLLGMCGKICLQHVCFRIQV